MSRPKSKAPSYRYHISGQARVTLDGRDYFLGQHDSPESWAKYHALLQQYHVNGMKMPENVETHDAVVTVRCVTAEFRQLIPTKYANSRSHAGRFRNLCRLLEDECGDTPADEFGPRRLAELRDLFVASGNSRKYVNAQVQSIRAIFKHAVSRELVDVNVVIRLATLESLKEGQTTAPETEPVLPVSLDDVRKTAGHLSRIIRDMVWLQVTTGMRPSEVCNLRPCDIEVRKDGVWVYRPPQHKTKSKGKRRAIPIVGDIRITLGPYLDRDQEAYCFSPREAVSQQLAKRAEDRKTPLKYGNRPGTNKKVNPKRQPGERYDKDSYRKAIQRAAKNAGVDRWTPYQLRHAAATAVRAALGIEAAQALLGHSRIDMTEHYAQVSEAKAIEAAKSFVPTIEMVETATR